MRTPAAAELLDNEQVLTSNRKCMQTEQYIKAWMHDASHLSDHAENRFKVLPRSTDHYVEPLTLIAAAWSKATKIFIQRHKEHDDNRDYKEVIPPYTRTQWRSQEGPPSLHTPGEGLKVATLGWWEIAAPTVGSYMRLRQHLVKGTQLRSGG